MNRSLQLTKLDSGLKSVELVLKNIEYKRLLSEEGSHNDEHSILCQGDITKINEAENKNLFTTSGVGGKLDMSFLPNEISSCNEVEISLFERSKLIEKRYQIYGSRFEVDIDLPMGVIQNINKIINENYSKENFKFNMTLNFINPIYEIYKTNFSTISKDDQIVLYLGEEYQDDDSNYGYDGEVKINLNISYQTPFGMDGQTDDLFSFRY